MLIKLLLRLSVFDITFSAAEWETIQPREKIYHEKRDPKTYKVLLPYEWSNVLQYNFFLHTQLPCSLKFEKENVSEFGILYLRLNGRCSDCGSIFEGIIDSIPGSSTRLVQN